MNQIIYKICSVQEWKTAQAAGVYTGAPIDVKDGFIHFSSVTQVAETAAKHFDGLEGLMLLSVDIDMLGDNLRWEPSRDVDLFPHLYAPMPVAAVKDIHELAWRDGAHVFPQGIIA